MKLIVSAMFLLSGLSAIAAPTAACQKAAQDLSSALPTVKGLGLSTLTNAVVKECGVNAAVCENKEPGYAYYSYKAFCVLAQVKK